MKRLLITATFLYSTIAATAQTSSGALAIGATVGLVTSSQGAQRNTSFSFYPNISYFLSDKLSLGVGIGYRGNSSSKEFKGNPETYRLKSISDAFIVNPYAKYFIPLGEKTYFTLQGELAVAFGSAKNQYYNAPDHTVHDGDRVRNTTIGLGVLPGIMFFPSEKIGIELNMGSSAINDNQGAYLLGFTTYKEKGGESLNTFSLLNLNSLSVNVSAYYFIK